MIKLDENLVRQIKERIISAKNIMVLAHKNPDGDTMGASLALYLYLKGLNKDVTIACYNGVADGLKFLPGLGALTHEIDESKYDLLIMMDTAVPKLSGLMDERPEIFNNKGKLINIDHHSSNSNFAGINLVVPDSASTTQILYYLFKEFKAIFTRDIATCLLTGLYTDTGSFMHQNTTAETLRVGGALLRHGADMASISKNFFNTKPVNQLRLWGRVLDRSKLTEDGVVMSAITNSDLQELGADKEQLSGAIEYLKYVPGIRYAEILVEESDGRVKGSLRTIRDDVNVSDIAAEHGGGGHVKAAGFTMPGRLEREVSWKVVEGK